MQSFNRAIACYLIPHTMPAVWGESMPLLMMLFHTSRWSTCAAAGPWRGLSQAYSSLPFSRG